MRFWGFLMRGRRWLKNSIKRIDHSIKRDDRFSDFLGRNLRILFRTFEFLKWNLGIRLTGRENFSKLWLERCESEVSGCEEDDGWRIPSSGLIIPSSAMMDFQISLEEIFEFRIAKFGNPDWKFEFLQPVWEESLESSKERWNSRVRRGEEDGNPRIPSSWSTDDESGGEDFSTSFQKFSHFFSRIQIQPLDSMKNKKSSEEVLRNSLLSHFHFLECWWNEWCQPPSTWNLHLQSWILSYLVLKTWWIDGR